jgi:DNA-directed RNA polymerase beta subunit
MSSKQIVQSLTHLNCERPYTIGDKWYYLTNNTRLFREQAKENGSIVFSNNNIMIVIYESENGKNADLKTLSVPEYIHTSRGFASRLRYKKESGDFKKGEILYEYDCFIDGVPSFGYNVNTMFFPFFGINFEDCIVISESLSHRIRYQKTELITIPIYTYSLFKMMYEDSKYGFIPEIGQFIKKNIIAVAASNKNANKNNSVNLNFYDFASIVNNKDSSNLDYVISKLNNAKVVNIKIHGVPSKNSNNKPLQLVDKKLQQKIEILRHEYYNNIKNDMLTITELFGRDFANKILKNHYVSTNPKTDFQDIQTFTDLAYIIELQIVEDKHIDEGDKLSNRFAHKGVVGLKIPDELRPINAKTKEPIDLILGPLSVYARSNFGTVLEGLINKTIKHCESEILKHKNAEHTHGILNKLSNISILLDNNKYAEEINGLSDLIKSDHKIFEEFIDSLMNGGLYYEAKNFVKCDAYKLQHTIKQYFDISTNDTVILKKELFEFVKNYLDISDLEIPKSDVYYPNIYNAPIYTMQLEHTANGKFSARDIGEYSKASKQPVKDIYGQNKGSHIGTMEFDALIAHNNIHTIREFHTVKSDSIDFKKDMNVQLITTGRYEMPKVEHSKSYTRMIINSLMKFLSEN